MLLDTRGFVSEGIGSNVFFVKDGELLTPKADYVLPGVSRAVVLELAAVEGLVAHEEDISLEQARNADEAFITSTSFCICPVRSYDERRMDKTGIPGPITRQLSDAFAKEAQFDFVGQYLDALAE